MPTAAVGDASQQTDGRCVPLHSNPDQALTLSIADAVAVLSPSALLLWSSGRWVDVNTLGASLRLSDGCRACEGARDGQGGVFVACSGGVSFLQCDWSSAAPSSCSSLQLLALPLRPIVAAVASGSSLFLAPATGGLLRVDFAATSSPNASASLNPPRLYLEPACNPHPGLPPYGDLKALAAYCSSPSSLRLPPHWRHTPAPLPPPSAIYRCSWPRQLHCRLPNTSATAHHRAAAGAGPPRRHRHGRRQHHSTLSLQATRP